MLLTYLAFEAVLLCFAMLLLVRPTVPLRAVRTVLSKIRLMKPVDRGRPITKWRRVLTLTIGLLLAWFVVDDWSDVQVAYVGKRIPVYQSADSTWPNADTRRAIDAVVRPMVASGKWTGAVVGVTDGNRKWVLGLGRKELRDGNPPTGDTLFEIGSMTKTFTTALLASMCGEGAVELEEPVGKLLPQSVRVPEYRGRKMTLVDLATQTSGLPRMPTDISLLSMIGPNTYAEYSPERMYRWLNSYGLARAPGSKYEYSNLGMGLLGLALSRREGSSYEDAVTSVVCKPLGMKDTVSSLSPAQRLRLARGYNAFQSRLGGFQFSVPEANWPFQDSFAGCGALLSTADDMLKFLAANMCPANNPLGMALKSTHKPRHKIQEGLSIGMAWHILEVGGEPIVWHNGGTGGYSSFMGFCEARKIAVVVLTNSAPDLEKGDADVAGFGILVKAFRIGEKAR